MIPRNEPNEKTPLLQAENAPISTVVEVPRREQNIDSPFALDKLSDNKKAFDHLLTTLTLQDVYNFYHTNKNLREKLKKIDHLGIAHQGQFYSCREIFSQLKRATTLNSDIQALEKDKEDLKNSCMSGVTASDCNFNIGCSMPCIATADLAGCWMLIGTPILCCTPLARESAFLYGAGVGFGGFIGCASLGGALGWAFDQFYHVTGLKTQDKIDKINEKQHGIRNQMQFLNGSGNSLWNTIKLQHLIVKSEAIPAPVLMRK